MSINKPKITIIAQDYKPVRVASSVRVERMVNILSEKYKVTLITGFPVYNQNALPKEYRGKFYRKERDGKLTIYRTYTYFSKSSRFLPRLWSQLSFMFSSFWVGLFVKSDLIIATSPPLFSGYSGAMISLFKQTKFILDVRDLWPESMIVLGILTNKFMIFGARLMENFIYNRASVITVVTPRILNHLQARLQNKKIHLLTNATDTAYFKPKQVDKGKYGYKKTDFVVSYIGNFGRAQALDKILKAAEVLKKDKKVKFLLVGQGDDAPRLKKKASKLTNVRFMDYQPKEVVLDLTNMSDVCLVTLAKNKLFEGAIPSKTFEYLACQKAVIASAKGDISKVIINGETGLLVPPEDYQALAAAVQTLAKNPDLNQKIGLQGRRLILKRFSQKAFAKELFKAL